MVAVRFTLQLPIVKHYITWITTCASFFKQTRRESSWSCLKYPIKTNGLPWDTSFPILSLSIPHIRLPIFAIDNKSKSRFSNLTVFFLIIQRMKNPFATCFYLYINYNPTNVIKTLFRCSTMTLFLLFYHDPFPLSQWSIETNFRKRAQTTFVHRQYMHNSMQNSTTKFHRLQRLSNKISYLMIPGKYCEQTSTAQLVCFGTATRIKCRDPERGAYQRATFLK